MSDRHALYAVVHDTTAIPGVNQLGFSLGGRTINEPSAAELSPRFACMVEQRPRMSFTTRAIATALGLCGVDGTDISTLTTGGLIGYLQQFADGGSRAGATAHRKIAIAQGLLYPTRLSVSHGGLAEISYEAFATYDGSNDPIVITESQSLPEAPADTDRYGLGVLEVGGVTIGLLTSLEIDFGLKVMADAADGEIWPDECWIAEFIPRITLRTKKAKAWGAAGIDMEGKQATHANTEFFLRHRTRTGFVADATESHVKFTAAGLAHFTEPFNANGTEPGEATLVIETEYDGTNDPIVIDTAAAISE
jgi:hypothetical protein